MSWSALNIQPTAMDAAGLLASSLDRLSVREVTPWRQGVADVNGHYGHLSFPNAVEALSQSIDVTQSCFALGIAASSLSSFISQCELLTAVFPFKLIQQWQRRATLLKPLEVDKYKLPVAPGPIKLQAMQSSGLPVVNELRGAALQQTAKAAASAFDSTNPIANLTAFQTEKAASDGAIDQAVANINSQLSGGAGWRFYAEGDLANALTVGMPGHDQPLTAIVLFLGTPAELALLNEVFSA